MPAERRHIASAKWGIAGGVHSVIPERRHAVKLLIGTAEGLFVGGASAQLSEEEGGTPAQDLRGRSVRPLFCRDGTLFAGTDDGVYRSFDGGGSWHKSGLQGRMVWDIAASEGDGGTLYAGTQPAGVYCSRDNGESWADVPGFLKIPGAETWCVPNNPLGARARTIVCDPVDPRKLQVGIEVGGIVSTRDGGSTWQCTLPGNNPDIHFVVAHPHRSDVLFATTGYGRIDDSEPMAQRSAGLFGSDDGGASWHYLWGDRQPRYTRPICIDPRAPYALTVACAPTAFSSIRDPGGAQAMLYRSDDDGVTWRSLGDTAHAPSGANFLAVACDATEAGHVLVGTETGEVWRVSPNAKWKLLQSGLPAVQGILAAAMTG